ncbi:MAG: polysaccharide deacetylase family protein, partial [Patescibacteria group bacterium]
MKWACFLHFYQPPTQTEEILNKVTDEAYRRIFKELENAPDAHLTLNVTSCLLDLWSEYGLAEMIDRLGGLLESGQVELTSSAKYHPVLPKLPPEEIRRQIELDLETHQKYFGDLYKPKGFFPPESAYNRYLAEIVSEYDFQWVLAEEISYQGGFGQVKYDRVYK